MLSHLIHEISLLCTAKNNSFVWYDSYWEECDRNIMENRNNGRDKEKTVKVCTDIEESSHAMQSAIRSNRYGDWITFHGYEQSKRELL